MDRKSQPFKLPMGHINPSRVFKSDIQPSKNREFHIPTDEPTKSFQLPPISDEQINVVANSDNNIVVDSVAGSGKTTTILHLAKTMQDLGNSDIILLLTYNKKLKLETRKKIDLLGLKNIEAHSYHSCAVKYYDHECYDDYKLMHVVKSVSNMLAVSQNRASRLPPFTRIIIDEAQDMTELYFKFVCTLIRDIPTDRRFLKFAIIGDQFQSIFAFNGADKRFIQYADILFAAFTSISTWIPAQLSTSYRITRAMAGFINEVALKNDRLRANKDGGPVEYIICNTFGQYPSEIVHRALAQKDYKTGGRLYQNDDIFIIAPSVKSMKSPVRKVANYLSAMRIPIHVPGSDEEPLDEDILRGKVAFSTFHQVKGLERKVVFVFGFDASYFDFYAKNLARDVCPNTLYVAITRAMEQMYIFHHAGDDYLPFLDKDRLLETPGYMNMTIKEKIHTSSSRSVQTNINVADFTRHISAKVVCDAMGFFEYKEVAPSHLDIEIPIRIDSCKQPASKNTFLDSKSNKDTMTETVAEINGIALASYFEYISTFNMQILDELVKEYSRTNKLADIKGLVFENYSREESPLDYSFDMTPENLLRLANQYCAYRTEYIYKLNQIDRYDWLTDEHLVLAMERMKGHLSAECNFEIEVNTQKSILGKNVNGRLDIFDRKTNTLWEIKAVKTLKFDHLIQTAIYGYLFQKLLDIKPEYQAKYLDTKNFEDIKPLTFKTFNILSGQIFEVSFDPSSIEGMLEMIIYAKYFEGKSADDDEFVRELLQIQADCSRPFDPNRARTAPPPISKKIEAAESKSVEKILEDDFVF